MTGRRVGRLRVVSFYGTDRWQQAMWLCECDCGRTIVVRGHELRRKPRPTVYSCGCYRIDVISTHRHCHMPEYRTWIGIKTRCHRPSYHQYKDYGGRGIRVCSRWRHSFPNFLADMGRKPSRRHGIERRDNNGNYEPGNCRWATQREQRRNSRSNHYVTWRGRTQCLADWANEFGINRAKFAARIANGWSMARATRTP